jgi:hypothetical protein
MPPMLGSSHASGGYSQKSVTPTTLWPRPNAKRVSVIDGEVEMIRDADLLSLLPAQREDAVRSINRSTADKIAVHVYLKSILMK